MRIIIAGAGEVGFHLAKLLSYEAQETTHELRRELRITLADEPGDQRPIYLRLSYPAVPEPPPLEDVKRARLVVEKFLPAGSTVAPVGIREASPSS